MVDATVLNIRYNQVPDMKHVDLFMLNRMQLSRQEKITVLEVIFICMAMTKYVYYAKDL
jgi:hypothetical protein